ncbi:hypothetical protein [Sphingomonas sp.]
MSIVLCIIALYLAFENLRLRAAIVKNCTAYAAQVLLYDPLVRVVF